MQTIKSNDLKIVALTKNSAIFTTQNGDKFYASKRVANRILRGPEEFVIVKQHYEDRDFNWLGTVSTL